MSQPHFYLKDTKSKSDTSIFLYWYVSGRQFKYTTGIKIAPRFWSTKKERIAGRAPNADVYNDKLNRMYQEAIIAYEDIIKTQKAFDSRAMKARLDIIKKGTSGRRVDIGSFFIQTIEDKYQSKTVTHGTAKHYGTSLRLFLSYCEQAHIRDFHQITHSAWQGFEQYLISLDYSNNYLTKVLSRVRTTLRQALKKGITDNTTLQALDIQTKREKATSIYLNDEEINQWAKLDLSQNKRLDKARDLFLLGALTGLRYSDFIRLTMQHIRYVNNHPLIYFHSQKTGADVVIPAHEDVLRILDKYGGKAPHLSDQKLRDYIKEIGEACGFLNDMISHSITKGGQRQTTLLPRWQLLGTHTARRSFATNAYLRGLDTISIMQITGHSTETEFMKYIRISKEENALRIAQAQSASWQNHSKALRDIAEDQRLPLSEEDRKALIRIAAKMN